MKLVTDRKLIAASRALLALAECDDLDDRAWAAVQAFAIEHDLSHWGEIDLDRNRPTSDRCVRMAHLLSRMLSSDAAADVERDVDGGVLGAADPHPDVAV